MAKYKVNRTCWYNKKRYFIGDTVELKEKPNSQWFDPVKEPAKKAAAPAGKKAGESKEQ